MAPKTFFAFLRPARGSYAENAEAAIALSQNKQRYIPPRSVKPSWHRGSESPGAGSSDDDDDDDDDGQSISELSHHDDNEESKCLGLAFEDCPKRARALLVGWKKWCDIVLQKLPGVGGYHFAILFDDKNRLVVRDLGSTNGISVTYDGECDERRVDFLWIVGGDENVKGKRIIIDVARVLKFELVVVDLDTNSPEYLDKVARFGVAEEGQDELQDLEDLLEVGALGIQSRQPTRRPTGMQTPSSGRLVMRRKIGKGSYATVYRTWDVSTGEVYASKVPLEEEQRLGWIRVDKWEKEVEILKQLSHEHIVKFLGAQFSPSVELQFEFVPAGSLDRYKTTSVFECTQLATQCLSALEYLHECRVPIVHRDIKPENVLVAERTSNSIFLKLADFGLSNSGTVLFTFCGTLLYLAPELSEQRQYRPTVDIWSLGVVIFERLCGLPDEKILENSQDDWRDAILARLSAFPRLRRKAALLDFLSNAMLLADPNSRWPAGRCLAIARRFPEGDRIRHRVPKPGSTVEPEDDLDSEDGGADSDSEVSTIKGDHEPNGDGEGDQSSGVSAFSETIDVAFDIFGPRQHRRSDAPPRDLPGSQDVPLPEGGDRQFPPWSASQASSGPYCPPSIGVIEEQLRAHRAEMWGSTEAQDPAASGQETPLPAEHGPDGGTHQRDADGAWPSVSAPGTGSQDDVRSPKRQRYGIEEFLFSFPSSIRFKVLMKAGVD